MVSKLILESVMIERMYEKPADLEKKIQDWEEPTISEIGKGILEERYLMKDEAGEIIETDKEMFYRVAHVIAGVDSEYGDFNPEETEREFYDLMVKGEFLPNSPTLRGAGLGINLSACYVVPVEDSREGIFKEGLYNAVEIQAHGGGTGFNFSKLRHKGALIKSTKGKASGPIPFIGIYDHAIGDTIAQGGTRQGANMGILGYDHPDIEEFIVCKAKDGRIKNFNLSVGVTEEFMEMVKKGGDYPLIDYQGKEIKKVNVQEIFNKIIHNAWRNGTPGIVYLDRINRDNPTPHVGKIEGTNPCGEQPLLDLEACNIGSVNARACVTGGKMDWNKLERVVYSSVHLLDNVIDANKYPVEKTEKEKKELRSILEEYVLDKDEIENVMRDFSASPIESAVKGNRKIGLGIMGFANLLVDLGIEYGSEKSYEMAEDLMKFINEKAKEASVKLAETRGIFPNWKGSVYDSEGEYFNGENLKLRNATVTTIAPTGTISTLLGVNGGIEPIFALAYLRKAVYDENGKPKLESWITDSEFEKIAREESFYDGELIKEIVGNRGSLDGIKRPKNVGRERWKELQRIFVTAHDLSYQEHIRMQNTFQKYVGNAISKTINLPHDATEEDVRDAYMMTLETSVKGITVYRDESRKGQVLSTKQLQALTKDGRPKVLGTTIKRPTPLGNAFITLNVFKDNPSVPYESFVEIGKGGKDVAAISEGFGRLLSLSLKNGIGLEDIIEQLEGISGESQTGIGNNKIFSLPDAIAKGLREAYSELGESEVENMNNFSEEEFSGNFCPECGSRLIMMEGCQKCACGYSKC